MISENDTVYIEIDGNKRLVDRSFSSKQDVIEFIKSNHEYKLKRGTKISFGTCEFSEISDTDTENVSIEKANTVELTESEEKILNSIVQRAESDERIVDSATDITDVRAEKDQQNLRFENAVDFAFYLDIELFDDVPISAYEEDQVETVKTIFEDIVQGQADYLGFNSSYASRGRRDPFVAVYGRIHRSHPKEAQFRELYQKPFFSNHHWNDFNFSPIPIKVNPDIADPKNPDQDYILVLNTSEEDTSLDFISDQKLTEVSEQYDYIEENTDFKVEWIGKTRYLKNFDHICFGITFKPEME